MFHWVTIQDFNRESNPLHSSLCYNISSLISDQNHKTSLDMSIRDRKNIPEDSRKIETEIGLFCKVMKSCLPPEGITKYKDVLLSCMLLVLQYTFDVSLDNRV